MLEQNYTPVGIKLITTTNEQVEGLFSMFRQQVDPNGVVATLESRSAKVIGVHVDAEPVTLHGSTSSRDHCEITSLFTYRICGQTHCLMITGNKEIHLPSIVDRILDLHLGFGKRNLYKESPKSVWSNSIEIHAGTQSSRGLDMQCKCLPAASAIHVYLLAKGTPFYYIRPLEVLGVCSTRTLTMGSTGIGWVRA
jgi:hypothetical protein